MALNLTEAQALLWTQRLIALALMQQAGEFLVIRGDFGLGGAWSWRILRQDFQFFPRPMLAVLDTILGGRWFIGVIALQLILGATSLAYPRVPVFVGLLLTHTLICLRWRGTFNGGSDFMTLVVLTALVLAGSFGEGSEVVRLALIYISLHSIASYCIAGAAKVSSASWRSGQALRYFTAYVPAPQLARLMTGVILLFECSFPLAVSRPEVCVFYIGLGLCFHIGNAWVLGLNRFILPWGATYPALLFLSQWAPAG